MTETLQTFTTNQPLDDFARRLMDEGYRLCPRENVNTELARLGPSKHSSSIIIYRAGTIHATTAAAARTLAKLTGVSDG